MRRQSNMQMIEDPTSYFDGGLLSYVGWRILGALLTIFTFGLAFPWAACFMYRWEVENTVISGRRLHFTGTGLGLFGNWIKWWFLILITLGIYSFWVHIKLIEWKTKHTYVIDEFVDEFNDF